jgi:protein ImuB
MALTGVSGPQRISGGAWHDTPYAREYFRCVSEAGAILWLFRDARDGAWYLHGWWD